jgi:hypothetical protein
VLWAATHGLPAAARISQGPSAADVARITRDAEAL